MNSRSRNDVPGAAGGRQTVEKTVSTLAMLARSEEACRLLGVDGVLADQADVAFLDDPLDYLAYDIAAAVHEAADEIVPAQGTMLSTLVAELRMCQLIAVHVDQYDLTERVMRHLREMQS
jgi:hypothetical protein